MVWISLSARSTKFSKSNILSSMAITNDSSTPRISAKISAASSDLVLSIIFAATLNPPICAAEIDVDSENLACITFSNWFKAESDIVSSVAKREITDAFKSTLR